MSISVIIPCYRAAATLRRAVDSALTGAPADLEVLLVDDVMTAGTAVREVIPKLKAEANVEVIGLVLSVDRIGEDQGFRHVRGEGRRSRNSASRCSPSPT